MNKMTYITLPQPDEIPEHEREDAMGAYLMMFAAVASALPLPVINLIAAIVYYFVNRRKSLFVHFHSLQSLLSQLPTTLMNWGLLYWVIHIWILEWSSSNELFFTYLYLTITANITYIVFSIVAMVKARNGKMYYFLVIGKLCYEIVFRSNSNMSYEAEKNDRVMNLPPV